MTGILGQLKWASLKKRRKIFRRLCCRGPPPVKPNFSVVCLGLKGSGKSTLLAVLSGESSDEIAPTVGFSIKALMFRDCFVDVKELGGGDNVRPYWDKYFQGAQGVIYVIDSTCDEDEINQNRTELDKAMDNEELDGLPLLVLANQQDKLGARKPSEISEILHLDDLTSQRHCSIHGCSTPDRDSIQRAFETFNASLIGGLRAGQGDKSDGEFHKIS